MRDFFLYLSITDPDFIRECPRREFYRQEIIGMAVFLSSVFAALSGGYAIHTVFENVYISLFLGVLWGCMILIINMQIVGSSFGASSELFEAKLLQKYIFPLILRVPLAILLGIIIAVPLELRIIEPEINAYLVEVETDKTRQIEKEAATQKENQRIQFEQQSDKNLERLDNDIKELEKELHDLQDKLGDEERKPIIKYVRRKTNSGKYIQVPIRQESEKLRLLRKNVNTKQNAISTKQKEIEDFRRTYKQKKQEIEQSYQNAFIALGSSTEERKTDNKTPTSLLSRYKALSVLSSKDADTTRFRRVLQLLIILIEIMPVVLKILSDSGPYERNLEHYDREQAFQMRRRNVR